MENSNQPAAEPAKTEPAPQPVVPKASAPVNNGVVPGGKPGSSKGLIIGLVGGGVAVIAIVLICIFAIPKLFGVNWEETKSAADKLYDINESLDSDCKSATNYAADEDVSEKEYNKYVSECQSAVDEYDNFVKELGNVSGVKRNKEIKAKYEEFKKAYEEAGPILRGIPELLSAEHKVMLSFEELSNKDDAELNDSVIEDLIKPLRNVESEGVKDVANSMADELENYLKIVARYTEAQEKYYGSSYSDPNHDALYEEYKKARDAYYDADLDLDLDSLTESGKKLDKAAEALYKEMNNQYYQNK